MRNLVVPQRGIVGLAGQPLAPRVPAFDPEDNYRQDTFRQLGDLDDIELFFNDVLVAKYIRKKVSENFYAAPETEREDNWQGVVGLVLKVGPRAFVNDANNNFHGITVKPGDWVLYRNSDGWDKDIRFVGEYTWAKCRIIQDVHIRGRVRYPGRLL